TIWGDRNIKDHASNAGIVDIFFANRRIVRQGDDAIVVVAELQFSRRTQHAIGWRAANGNAALEFKILARNISAGEGKDRLHARLAIGRAADDVDQFAGPRIDLDDIEV